MKHPIMLYRLLMAAPLTLVATGSHAQYVQSTVSAADIVQECNKPRRELQADFCTGYILGVFDALSLSKVICPGGGGSVTLQAVAIAKKYLNEHPELWDRVPSFLNSTGFKQAFPCG